MADEPAASADSTDNPADAAKDRFREALERKKGHKHPHEAASQNDAKVHDAHAAAGGKRTFRRKSG